MGGGARCTCDFDPLPCRTGEVAGCQRCEAALSGLVATQRQVNGVLATFGSPGR